MLSTTQARARFHRWITEASEGYSVAEIARGMGVRWNTARDWMAGTSVPDAATWIRLAHFLGHPIAGVDP